VYGEIYKILNSRLLLPELDTYEQCTQQFPEPHEYIRKKLTITLLNSGNVSTLIYKPLRFLKPLRSGNNLSAWVYIFNHTVQNLMPIYSGDYLHYLNAPKKR
jgi:gamma-glutamylcyclotransferase (GGCT)/AIG2-like uncharacterized protein YtfP